jgi:hypothetical protein
MTVLLPGVGVGVGAAGGVVVLFSASGVVEPPPHDIRVTVVRIKAA